MLLRSSSSPILNSCLTHSKDSSSSLESDPALTRTRLVSYTSSFISPLLDDDSIKRAHSALSQLDFHIPPKPKKKNLIPVCHRTFRIKDCEQEPEEKLSIDSKSSFSALERLFSSSGLGEKGMDNEESFMGKKETLEVGGGAGGGGGSRRGRRGSDGGDNGGSGFFESNNHGNDSTDTYYQNMIESNPGNSLLLGNYAKFLIEERKDYAKAEEYCERAILTNPSDGNILSVYADLVWRIHKDAPRAEKYFKQAVKTSPDDCYIQASYAHFLWDAEDEEEEEEEAAAAAAKKEEDQRKCDHYHTSRTASPFFHGASLRQPITAEQQHRSLMV